MKVAAYQAPLFEAGCMDVISLIQQQVEWCENNGVEMLCCPEAILGGLADNATDPNQFAIDVSTGALQKILAPFSSNYVTTIIGFTEIDSNNNLYNSAAVFHKGAVAGVYRKHHTAINQSVYQRGDSTQVFTVGSLTFGIIICRDSLFTEPARAMVQQGATVFFVPTNNALPPARFGPEVVSAARWADSTLATELGVHVVRADVAGSTNTLVSYGSSGIMAPGGVLLAQSRQLTRGLIVAELVGDIIVADIEPTR